MSIRWITTDGDGSPNIWSSQEKNKNDDLQGLFHRWDTSQAALPAADCGFTKKQKHTLPCRPTAACPNHQLWLTGVEQDHGLQAHVLLPLKLELTEPRGRRQQHVEDLHDALHTLTLLPEETQMKKNTELRKYGAEICSSFGKKCHSWRQKIFKGWKMEEKERMRANMQISDIKTEQQNPNVTDQIDFHIRFLKIQP